MSIEAELTELNQTIADYIANAEKHSAPVQVAAIEQALIDLVGALEGITKTNMGGVIDAIKGLKLGVTVNVNPTPFEINLPAQAQVEDRPFRPLVLKVTGWNQNNGRIETCEIFEKQK